MQVSEFTSQPNVHYRYSDWDEISVFTCTLCGTIWLLVCSYTDRPPYVNSAEVLTANQLGKVLQATSAELDAMVKKGTSYALRDLILK